jgi:hypothetical protein
MRLDEYETDVIFVWGRERGVAGMNVTLQLNREELAAGSVWFTFDRYRS